MPHTRTEALPFRSRTSLVQRLTHALAEATARRRDRRALAQLDLHLLHDIGLTKDEARTESAKPFWQP